MVPVQSPCHSCRRPLRVEERIAEGDHVVEYPLHVCKMFWSRSDFMHVAIAWDRIQMGLRKGNTMLIYFRSGVVLYQCVLIALASDLSKPRQGQHKFWRYVSPVRTYFAWLPEQLARTYCSAALDEPRAYIW